MLTQISCVVLFVGASVAGFTQGISLTAPEVNPQSIPKTYFGGPHLNTDGTKFIFRSTPTKIGAGAPLSVHQVYLQDPRTSTRTLLSRGISGQPFNADVNFVNASRNGRYVTYSSAATNVSIAGLQGQTQVYLNDTVLNVARHISYSTVGTASPDSTHGTAVSDDGRLVAYVYGGDFRPIQVRTVATRELRSFPANIRWDENPQLFFAAGGTLLFYRQNYKIFVLNTDTWQASEVSTPFVRLWSDDEFDTEIVDVSEDGRFLLVNSRHDYPFVNNETTFQMHSFIFDRATNSTTLVTPPLQGFPLVSGARANDMSDDGRFVTFVSNAPNLRSYVPSEHNQVYLYDRQTDSVQLVSTSSFGSPSNSDCYFPAISGDGSKIAFVSVASNLDSVPTNGKKHLFLRDSNLSTTLNRGMADWQLGSTIWQTARSGDGNKMVMLAASLNSASGGIRVPKDYGANLLRNNQTGKAQPIGLPFNGIKPNIGTSDFTNSVAISGSGRYIAFVAGTSNVVPEFPNTLRHPHVYVYDSVTGITEHVSKSDAGVPGDNGQQHVRISRNGRYVLFNSYSRNLVPNDTNEAQDNFVYDRIRKTTRRVSTNSNGSQLSFASTAGDISSDGQYVVFFTNTYSTSCLKNIWTGELQFVGTHPTQSVHNFQPMFTSNENQILIQTAAAYDSRDTNTGLDWYVWNKLNNSYTLETLKHSGTAVGGVIDQSFMSPDMSEFYFKSAQGGVVPGHEQGQNAWFVRNRITGSVDYLFKYSNGNRIVAEFVSNQLPVNGRTIDASVTDMDILPLVDVLMTDTVRSPKRYSLAFQRTPDAALVSGYVTLSNWVGPRDLPSLTFELIPTGGGASVQVENVVLGVEGWYGFHTALRGTFTLKVKAPTHLVQAFSGAVTLNGDDHNTGTIILVNGDVDNDNEIGPSDFSVLSSAYGSGAGDPGFVEGADLDGDNAVGPADFSILSSGFGQIGD